MAEKVLPYDRSIVPQETGYWCGPASTQIVLSGRGISVSEQQLAREIGTTWNGTDFVGLIERVLDVRVPDAVYTSIEMPNDPPTTAQVAALWRAIVASIDAGWGVIVNIVAPASNYPRGVKGSASPAYGGGTIFHYFPLMGYDDAFVPANPTAPWGALWVPDPGFPPHGSWITFAQLCTLIPPKAYCFAAADPQPAADDQLRRRYASRSKYRATDDLVGTLADFVLWIDARVHEESVERVS